MFTRSGRDDAGPKLTVSEGRSVGEQADNGVGNVTEEKQKRNRKPPRWTPRSVFRLAHEAGYTMVRLLPGENGIMSAIELLAAPATSSPAAGGITAVDPTQGSVIDDRLKAMAGGKR